MSTHSSTYGNLRKERKFARQLYFGIAMAVVTAMVLIWVVSQMKSFYRPEPLPKIEEPVQNRPMGPTQ